VETDPDIESELVHDLGHQRFERLNVIGAQHSDDRRRADFVVRCTAQDASGNAQRTLASEVYHAGTFDERFQDSIGNSQALHVTL